MYKSSVGGYANVQSVLRTGKPAYKDAWNEEQGQEHIKHLLDAFESNKSTEPKTLHRGMRVPAGHELLNLKPGQVISDKGVTSTSSSKAIASKFSEKLNRSDQPLMMEIRTPAGTRMISMKQHSDLDHEKEHLLAPDAKLRVVSAKSYNGVHKILLEHE